MRNWKGPTTTQITSKKKNKVGGLTSYDFKTYYKAIVIETVGFGAKVGTQMNGTEQSPEVDPHAWTIDHQRGCRGSTTGKGQCF